MVAAHVVVVVVVVTTMEVGAADVAAERELGMAVGMVTSDLHSTPHGSLIR